MTPVHLCASTTDTALHTTGKTW